MEDGYQVCDIIATDMYIGRYVLIYSKTWSRRATDYVSDADEILQAVRALAAATDGKGMFYGNELVGPQLALENIDSLSLIADDFVLKYRKQPATVSTLRRNCRTPFGSTVYRYNPDTKEEGQILIHYGAIPVHMDGTSRRLSLMAFKSPDVRGSFLIACNMRHRRREMYNALYTWLEGREASKAARRYKSGFNLASFRVVTYEKLQSLMTVLQATIYYESAVRQTGVSFESRIRFRPHPGKHHRDYLIPEDKIPHSRLTRAGPWQY